MAHQTSNKISKVKIYVKVVDKNYELIEHTADIGIRVKGKTLAELFKNAGLAVFEIIAEKKQSAAGKPETIKIEQSADNLEELFVNWLNELLSLSAAKELIFSDFQIYKLDKTALKAAAIGSNTNGYKVNVEIKAATYCELKMEKNSSGWMAEVIFDV